MNNDTLDDQLRAYLNGKLPGPERMALDERLATEPGLAERLAQLRVEIAVAEALIADDTRALFDRWKDEKKTGKPFFSNVSSMGWLASAVVLAVLFAAWWWQTQRSETPPAAPKKPETTPAVPVLEQQPIAQAPLPSETTPADKRSPKPQYAALANRYYREPVLTNMRSTASDTVKTPLQRTRDAYAAGQYERVPALADQVDSTRRQSADFLKAHSLYHLKRYREAETLFASVAASGNTQYRYPAEWSLLMCRLAQLPARNGVFQQQLTAILNNPNHPYLQQAKNLEKDLNKR